MRHSIRTQLLVTFIGMMLLTLVTVGLINGLFLGRFYKYQKTRQIKKTYQTINELSMSQKDDFSSDIMQISVQENIDILVTDSDFSEINSTGKDPNLMAIRLFGYYTGFYQDAIDVIEKTEKYVLQEASEEAISTKYLELWGQLDNGDWFLLWTPLESIEKAVTLSNEFYIVVGIFVTLIAVIAITILSGRITAPIIQLNDLSQRMANLDFEAKYSGHANNEIDQLGENFNKMSGELERTISELKTANAELQRDVKKREEIDEVRKDFLNNVSHELKTPIALISGYAEGLKDNIAEDKESRDFYCDVIIDESAKMSTMVGKLLSLNRLEFGNDPTVMERFDIVPLIRGVVQGMKLLLDEKGAQVTFSSEDSMYVWGDEFKIEEVVTNFMSNAMNHLDYERKIDIRVRREGNLVRTSVFNTGDPIPEADIDKIWDKFYKVDKARTREYGGSGIGLSIVKAIMDGHNQECGVKNYGNGVEFYFMLEGK
ncbi:MAG: HAMP domain-containing sensor histidine kinase [Lachnospiraceae bacterium]|nr:HAMP domain-containing sensor histidine kinase [Lachnospiraceae bacterium]